MECKEMQTNRSFLEFCFSEEPLKLSGQEAFWMDVRKLLTTRAAPLLFDSVQTATNFKSQIFPCTQTKREQSHIKFDSIKHNF